MRYAVRKYDLVPGYGVQELPVPMSARVLNVTHEAGQVALWALVDVDDTEVGPFPRRFITLMPDEVCPVNGIQYVGTLITTDCDWHVFEVL